MSEERRIRGNHVIPLLRYIQSSYDQNTQQTIYESLSETTRGTLEDLDTDVWYPASVVADLHRGLFAAQPDPEKGYAAIRDSGAAVAEYGVNTFMRLLIKLMTPEMLAKKWPAIWSKSHNFGKMQTALDQSTDRKLNLSLSEVDQYSYIGPCAVGFLSYSLKAMGRKDASVVERDLDYSRECAPAYNFEITW